MVRISLIVPTYNRATYLLKSIPSFLEQTIPSVIYEILIVDNNSNDNTREIIYDLMKSAKCDWRYIFEEKQGLHNARNRGIVEARGDIIVFGDDDIIASENWLKVILHEFDSNSLAGIVGGRILPLWDKSPEEWIYDYGTEKVHPLFAYLDYGEEKLVLHHEYVYGCNFAIRKNIAVKIGGSPPDTFPRKLKHLSGTGESAMIDEVRKLLFQIIYLPNALVYHHAEAARATLGYFIDRYERWAVEEVFHNFRYRTRSKATVVMVKKAKRMFVDIWSHRVKKRNFYYYFIIKVKSSLKILTQSIRVLFHRSLYKHITQKSYF